MNANINVTIVIPVYNGADCIERTLKSVLAQSFQNWLCIVVDDGSNDLTVERAAVLAVTDDRIKVIKKTRQGTSVQRNFSLGYAFKTLNTDWLVWLDCGDVLSPDFLTKRLEYLYYDLGLTPDNPAVLLGGYSVVPEIFSVLRRFLDLWCSHGKRPDWLDGKKTLENLLSFAATDPVALHAGGILSRKVISIIHDNLSATSLYPNEMINGPDYIACTRMSCWGVKFYFHSQVLFSIFSASKTEGKGEKAPKIIAGFPDFCRGGALHEPYYRKQTFFKKNALALRFYKRGQLIQQAEFDHPLKSEYATTAFALAKSYNDDVEKLSELIDRSPNLECKKELLKCFDASGSDLIWTTYHRTVIAQDKHEISPISLLTHQSYQTDSLAVLRRGIIRIKIKYFFDVGAGIGVFSSVLANNCPSLKYIYSFEPREKSFCILRKNIARLQDTRSVSQLPNFRLLSKKAVGPIRRNPSDQSVRNEVVCDEIIKLSNERIAIRICFDEGALDALMGMKQLLIQNECLLMIRVPLKICQRVLIYLKNIGYGVSKKMDGHLLLQPCNVVDKNLKSKPVLFLHAGLIKTGSSSIQRFIDQNHELMKLHDVRSAFGLGTHQKIKACLTDNMEEMRRFRIYSRKQADRFLQFAINKINKQRELYPGNDFYLTHENFFQTMDIHIGKNKWFYKINLERMKWFIGQLNYHVKLVVYLRRQDRLLLSAYNTYVTRFQLTDTFDEWGKPDLNYAAMLLDLAEIFGKENLIVRIFEHDQLVDASIIADFLAIFDLKVEDGFINTGLHDNQSLSVEAEEIIRVNLSKYNDYNEYFKYALAIAEIDRQRDNSIKPALSYEQRRAILKQYEDSNAFVAKNFFNREDGRLFSDICSEIHQPLLSSSRVSLYEVLRRKGLLVEEG